MSADPGNCCRNGGGPFVNDAPCASAYQADNWGSGACDQYLASFCATGDNMINQPACKTWMSKFPKGNRNIDTVITAYCARPENKNKSQCACITAVTDVLNETNLPVNFRIECVSNKCLGHPDAWRTSDMLIPCPELVYCNIDATDAKFFAGKGADFKANFVQKCGDTAAGKPAEPPAAKSKFSWWWIALIVLVAIVILVIIVLLVRKSRKE